jgi:hypothetical protein
MGGRRGDDPSPESLFHQQGQAPAVVQVGMGQEQQVDGGRVETERAPVLLVQLVTALVHATVDQDPSATAFDEVTGAGNLAVCAVKREIHEPIFASVIS